MRSIVLRISMRCGGESKRSWFLTAKKLLIDNPSAMLQRGEELSRKPPVTAAFDR